MSDMSIDQVLAQMRAMADQASGVQPQQKPAQGAEFGDLLKNSIDQVNATQQHAAELKQSFEMGSKEVNLAEVMVAVQKSSVSFEAMVEVRNKLVDAYKEIMNMPI